MNCMRKAGLAAAAAMVAMALIGASTTMASSTALCKKHEEPCAAGNTYQGHFEAVTKHPEFLTDAGDIACTEGTILGFALGLASPQSTHLEELTFGGVCLIDETFLCAVESTSLGLLLILRTALNLGTATLDQTRVLVNCPEAGFHCVFDMNTKLHVAGSPNANALAHISAVEAPLEVGEGLFCPSEASLDALYKITQPDPIAITK